MRMKSRKSLAILLTLMLVFAMSATSAFADWPSFQNDADNNGVIATAPPTALPTTDTVAIPQNTNIFSGISAPPVIDNGVSYTLYNGGYSNSFDSASGGARMRATTLSTGATAWDVKLNDAANSQSQLSTPIIVGSDIYAAVTTNENIYSQFGVQNWTVSSGSATITGGVASFPANTTSSIATTVAFTEDVSMIYLPTNLTGDGGTYTITLGGTTIASGSISSFSGTFDQYDGVTFTANTNHTLTISVTTDVGETATFSKIDMNRFDWAMYKVTTGGTVTDLGIGGEGQANTPIYNSGNYIFWGTWGGTSSYYQYDTTGTIALEQFTPAGGDDFYWAGALDVEIASVPHVAFGSESGKIYARPVGVNFDSGTGYTVDLTDIGNGGRSDAGRIRSTIMSDGTTYGYLTSVGTAGVGYLWRIDVAGNLDAIELPSNSTSTPVLSGNGYIYVGYYDFNVFPSEGGVVGVQASAFTTLFDVYGNGVNPMVGMPGDPVQASPIVYSVTTAIPTPVNRADYVYFTTNTDISPATNHNGYCYRVGLTNIAVPVPNLAWNPATGGTYALQGFAFDNGYVIYGDDSNTLYIFSN